MLNFCFKKNEPQKSTKSVVSRKVQEVGAETLANENGILVL